MIRREFLKNTLYSSALLTSPNLLLNSCFDNFEKKITILHTNDVHSHIEAFDSNHKKNPNKGGVSRRSSIIQKIRKDNPDTLLFDAGDIFQGTPYFNYFGGELEFKLMSMLEYDGATIGNHDFDNGIHGFVKQLPYAKFNFINSNYDFSNTALEQKIKPYQIFKKNNIKIGVFGLGIELDGLVTKKLYKETKYLDPVTITHDIVKKLKEEEKCDLIICLSHLGYEYKNDPNKICDVKIAQKTKDIDLIIGGHTHTFLKEPTILKNSIGNQVLVNQVGCYGLYLGQVDFYFDNFKSKVYNGRVIEV